MTRELKFYFIAAAAALVILGIMLSPALVGASRTDDRIVSGIILGGLASVVVYALMRAFQRGQDRS